jgi:ribosomal-protein-alanine N-acetyltransferase
MLSREKLFDRFSNIVPGSFVPGGEIAACDSDIYFEPLSISGLEEMHSYSIDPRLYDYFEFDPFKTIEETSAYIRKLENRMSGDLENKSMMYWFVRRKHDNHLIGTAGLVSLEYGRQSIEWGYAVDPKLWGEGYVLKIQETLKHYVFEVLELNRLHGKTMIINERTISSVLASGMKYEGTQRESLCKEGIYYDAWQYSMLKNEYFESTKPSTSIKSAFSVEDIVKLVSSVLEDEQITSDSTMYNTSNWDSLNHMSIIVALFEKTKISLSPIQISNATSVHSITQLINGKSDLQ